MDFRRNSIAGVYQMLFSRDNRENDISDKEALKKINIESLKNYTRLIQSLENATKAKITLQEDIKAANHKIDQLNRQVGRLRVFKRKYLVVREKYRRSNESKLLMSKSARMLLARLNRLELRNAKLRRRLSLTPPTPAGIIGPQPLRRIYSDRFLLSKVNKLVIKNKMENEMDLDKTDSASGSEESDEENSTRNSSVVTSKETPDVDPFLPLKDYEMTEKFSCSDLKIDEKSDESEESEDEDFIESPTSTPGNRSPRLEVKIPKKRTKESRGYKIAYQLLKIKIQELEEGMSEHKRKISEMKKENIILRRQFGKFSRSTVLKILETSRYMIKLEDLVRKEREAMDVDYSTVLSRTIRDLGLLQVYEISEHQRKEKVGSESGQAFPHTPSPRKDVVVFLLGQGILKSWKECIMSIFAKFCCVSFYELKRDQRLIRNFVLKTGSYVEIQNDKIIRFFGEEGSLEIKIKTKEQVFEVSSFIQHLLPHVEIKRMRK